MFSYKLINYILAIFLVLCFVTSGNLTYAQTSTESIKTITVTVKEKKNRFIPDLQANDFQVYQDGVLSPIVFIQASNQAPLNLAIVMQEGLEQLNLEINSIKQFITNLPTGSKIMVVYAKDNFVTVAQEFTTDLTQAASKIRVTNSFSSFSVNPYWDLKAVLPYFNGLEQERNEILFISDGFDPSNGKFSTATSNLYLDQVMREAQKNNVVIFSIFAPSARVKNFFAQNTGINSLIYLSEQTGGHAFYTNSGYVTFDVPLQKFAQLLKQQYVISYISSGIGKKYYQVKVTTDFSNLTVLATKEFHF
ncbi:MAG: hypothetical protein WAQ98_26175 [Blastocatellia bacterium]